MSGKSLDDYSDDERRAYEQGAADTHERYAAQEQLARDWLTKTIEVIAAVETHRGGWSASMIVGELRKALGLGTVKITCACDSCKSDAS